MTEKLPDSEKLLFDYFLKQIDHWQRQEIKTSKDLIEFYENNLTITDSDANCSCCGGDRDIIDDD